MDATWSAEEAEALELEAHRVRWQGVGHAGLTLVGLVLSAVLPWLAVPLLVLLAIRLFGMVRALTLRAELRERVGTVMTALVLGADLLALGLMALVLGTWVLLHL